MKKLERLSIFVFYNQSYGPQAWLSFSEEFKHVNTISTIGDKWIVLDYDPTGYVTKVINTESGIKILNGLKRLKFVSGYVVVEISKFNNFRWKPFLIRSCNEIAKYAASVDIGFTLNPRHLYSKLLKYDKLRNYQIISQWRRKDGISTYRKLGASSR